MDLRKNFYITTPLYYVTAAPHLGSLYSTLLADVFSRWQRLCGNNVVFTTGTDEHGQKVAQAAQQAGKAPQQFVDSFISDFKNTWHHYNIAYDHFIRTSDTVHCMGAQEFVTRIIKAGYTYQSTYEGWYCTPCETFVAREAQTAEAVLCPSCGRVTTWLAEQTHFFKLSAFEQTLLDFYNAHPDFIAPKERIHEVISFVKEGLKDLSISRTTVKWGVQFPQSMDHVIYVWVEALCGYLTSVGFGQTNRAHEFNITWPADLQVMGKDIIRFHAVYWPALLMAAGLALPKKLVVHGWIKVDKQKMSKSLGNVIDPKPLCEKYGADAVRYFLCRQIPINQDGEFNIADLEQRIASDLANDLGNLLNRMLVLAKKYDLLQVPIIDQWTDRALDVRNEVLETVREVTAYINDCMVHLAVARVWKLVNVANGYFHEQEPWKLAVHNKQLFVETIAVTAHVLTAIATLLWPIMPKKMEELCDALGVPLVANGTNDYVTNLVHNKWHQVFFLKMNPPLFEKPVIKNDESLLKEEVKVEEKVYITIDDLAKVELVVGHIDAASTIDKYDKLLSLTVDCGSYGKRHILAGIAKHYVPAELIGQQALFVVNLQPRKMAGTESQGMLLVAEDAHGKVQIMQPKNSVPNGTRLR